MRTGSSHAQILIEIAVDRRCSTLARHREGVLPRYHRQANVRHGKYEKCTKQKLKLSLSMIGALRTISGNPYAPQDILGLADIIENVYVAALLGAVHVLEKELRVGAEI